MELDATQQAVVNIIGRHAEKQLTDAQAIDELVALEMDKDAAEELIHFQNGGSDIVEVEG